MQLSDFRLKVFLCFILVYLYLQVSVSLRPANVEQVQPTAKHAVSAPRVNLMFAVWQVSKWTGIFWELIATTCD